MSTILTETEGFTPVIDVLAQELGLMTAVVYGIVWRYCQMKNKVCSASRETIAEHANISVKTVDRHLDKLCKAGYLKDLHPDWKHRPHIYADTGKLKIEALIKVKGGETESPTSKEGETESPTGETESPTGETESLTGETESLTGETESPTKIPSYDSNYDNPLGEKRDSAFPENPDDTQTGDDSRKEQSNGRVNIAADIGSDDPVVHGLDTDDHHGDSGETEAKIGDDFADGLDEYWRHCQQAKANKGGNFAAPAPAGGDDAFHDGPVDAFCEVLAAVLPIQLPRKKRRSWGDKLHEIAKGWSTGEQTITPEIMEAAIRAIPDDSEIGWKSFSSPYSDNFDQNIGPLLLRKGQPRQKKSSGVPDPDRFDRATAMTRERLAQHGDR